jgi:hypothetical protein
MIGIVEQVLRNRYGEPIVITSTESVEYRWNTNVEADSSTLYKRVEPCGELQERFWRLRSFYGDAVGGFLVGDSLKVSTLDERKVFGLHYIDELLARPEVRHANSLDPDICFFMDASNVWFYGIKESQLYVYDAEFEELDCLGDMQSSLEELIDQWEKADEKECP